MLLFWCYKIFLANAETIARHTAHFHTLLSHWFANAAGSKVRFNVGSTATHSMMKRRKPCSTHMRACIWLAVEINKITTLHRGAAHSLSLSLALLHTRELSSLSHIFAARRNVPCRRRRVPLYPGWHLPRRARGATMGPSCIYIRSNLGVGCAMGCRFIVSMKPPLQSTFRDYSSLSLERDSPERK